MQRIYIHSVPQRRYISRCHLSRLLNKIFFAWHHRLLGHPYQHRINLLFGLRNITGANNHISAATINFIG